MYDFSTLHPNSIAARDFAQQQTLPDAEDLLRRISEQSGKPISRLLREAKQGAKWPGRVTPREYASWRLYELDKRDRKNFVSEFLHWAVHDACMDEEWSEKTVDKWGCADVLGRSGIPTIPITAVIDRSDATYGDTPKIETTGALVDLLTAGALPLFFKPNRLLGSFGAFRVESLDSDKVVANGGDERYDVATMIEETLSDVPYVVQPVVDNHAKIRGYAQGLATLRTVNFVRDDSVRMDRAVFKIPAAGNIADNNWRQGNLLADVDPLTGVIMRVSRGMGPDMTEFANHPDTDAPLVGTTLPDWDDVCALNRQTSLVFGAISYQSLDIALTDAGPLVVEVNSGGSFALPQVASGRGLLSNENKSFFESCGFNFRKVSKPAGD